MKNLDELMEKHGPVAVQFESYLYNTASYYSEDYKGGVWTSISKENKNKFCLAIDDSKTYKIRNCPNFDIFQEDVEMDSKTFSLTMFAMAVNIFGNHLYSDAQILKKDGELSLSEDVEAKAQDYFELYYFSRDMAEELLPEKGQSNFYTFLD